jgi:hypothetical protein
MFRKGYCDGSSLDLTLGHVTVDIHSEGAILVHSEGAILAHSEGTTGTLGRNHWHTRKEPPTVRLQVEYKTGNPPQLEF